MTENLHGTPKAFEIQGRFLALLLDHTPVARTGTVTGLHIWQTRGGGCAVEWTGGPHAIEVIQELQTLADDDAVTTVLSPGDITDAEEYVPGWVRFRVRGIPFALRPVETEGVQAIRAEFLEYARGAV